MKREWLIKNKMSRWTSQWPALLRREEWGEEPPSLKDHSHGMLTIASGLCNPRNSDMYAIGKKVSEGILLGNY